MHNGERRNPLAGVPWNKYMPFVLVTRDGKPGETAASSWKWKKRIAERDEKVG